MMSKEKRRVPKLRFPGFTEDWEQRKLESLFTKYEDKVNTPSSGYWRLGLRSHCKGTFHTYIDAGNELETAEMNRVKSGNFILNITFAWERALAVTNDEDQDKLVSHRFPQFKPNNDLVIDFFKHTLMDKRFKHHLELSSPGGAGRNKVLKVADMLKYELLVPSIKEQNKISSFLNHVDYIITLHQRKLDNLKLKKKALLQKLFPKNGDRYPELRFPGFTDAWEQRKFKDIAFKRGKISEADLPYIEFEDINSGIGTLNKNILQKVGHKKGILFEAGDVLFGKLRPYLQNWLLCQFMGIAVGDFWVFQPQIVSSAFLYYLIQSEAYQSVANISSGTKMPRSSWLLVSETQFSIPKYKEATMIGEFFTSIDKNITLHQRKLDHLQLQKKALLQQMFV